MTKSTNSNISAQFNQISDNLKAYETNREQGVKKYYFRGKNGELQEKKITIGGGQLKHLCNRILYSFRRTFQSDKYLSEKQVLAEKFKEASKSFSEQSVALKDRILASITKRNFTEATKASQELISLQKTAKNIQECVSNLIQHGTQKLPVTTHQAQQDDTISKQQLRTLKNEAQKFKKLFENINTELKEKTSEAYKAALNGIFTASSGKRATSAENLDHQALIQKLLIEYANCSKNSSLDEEFKKALLQAISSTIQFSYEEIQKKAKTNIDAAYEELEQLLKDEPLSEERLKKATPKIIGIAQGWQKTSQSLQNIVKAIETSLLPKEEKESYVSELNSLSQLIEFSLLALHSDIIRQKTDSQEKLNILGKSLKTELETLNTLEEKQEKVKNEQVTKYSQIAQQAAAGKDAFTKLEHSLQALSHNLMLLDCSQPPALTEALRYARAGALLMQGQLGRDSKISSDTKHNPLEEIAKELNEMKLSDAQGKALTFSVEDFNKGTIEALAQHQRVFEEKISSLQPTLTSELQGILEEKTKDFNDRAALQALIRGENFETALKKIKSAQERVDQLYSSNMFLELRRALLEREDRPSIESKIGNYLTKHPQFDRHSIKPQHIDWSKIPESEIQQLYSTLGITETDATPVDALSPQDLRRAFIHTASKNHPLFIVHMLQKLSQNPQMARGGLWNLNLSKPGIPLEEVQSAKWYKTLSAAQEQEFITELKGGSGNLSAAAYKAAKAGGAQGRNEIRQNYANIMAQIFTENPEWMSKRINASTIVDYINWDSIASNPHQISILGEALSKRKGVFQEAHENIRHNKIITNQLNHAALTKPQQVLKALRNIKDTYPQAVQFTQPELTSRILWARMDPEETKAFMKELGVEIHANIKTFREELHKLAAEVEELHKIFEELSKSEVGKSGVLEQHPSIQILKQAFDVDISLSKDIREQVQQAKTKKKLIKEGHMAPDPAQKKGAQASTTPIQKFTAALTQKIKGAKKATKPTPELSEADEEQHIRQVEQIQKLRKNILLERQAQSLNSTKQLLKSTNTLTSEMTKTLASLKKITEELPEAVRKTEEQQKKYNRIKTEHDEEMNRMNALSSCAGELKEFLPKEAQ